MEHVQGVSLLEYLNSVGKTDEKDLRFIFTQVVQSLNKMHKIGVAHRDIKPENLMLDGNYRIRIIDLGFSFSLFGRDRDGFMRTQVGTLGYVAPEVYEGKKY